MILTTISITTAFTIAFTPSSFKGIILGNNYYGIYSLLIYHDIDI